MQMVLLHRGGQEQDRRWGGAGRSQQAQTEAAEMLFPRGHVPVVRWAIAQLSPPPPIRVLSIPASSHGFS